MPETFERLCVVTQRKRRKKETGHAIDKDKEHDCDQESVPACGGKSVAASSKFLGDDKGSCCPDEGRATLRASREKSRPVAVAPRRTRQSVSRPIWQCRCRTRFPDISPSSAASMSCSIFAGTEAGEQIVTRGVACVDRRTLVPIPAIDFYGIGHGPKQIVRRRCEACFTVRRQSRLTRATFKIRATARGVESSAERCRETFRTLRQTAF
jgi:hypothetical protein